MLKEIGIFAAGAAVGATAAAFVFKKKYAKKADEEIKSVVETYEQAMLAKETEEKEESQPEPDIPKEAVSSVSTATMTGIFHQEPPPVDEPYAISQEEYERNENGYSQESLYYYTDEVVANIMDQPIDVDNTIGREALRILDEEFGDKIYIRNEKLRMEWELNNDPRSFQEVREADWPDEPYGDNE